MIFRVNILLILISFLLYQTEAKSVFNEESVKRIVVDVDVGTDDYLALLVLFHEESLGNVKIEALICSNGNTKVKYTCKNLVRLLELIKRTDIPVYKGATNPLIPINPIEPYHGQDGFGDLKYDHEPDTSIIKDVPGSVGLYDIIMKNKKEIEVLCLGPLTTIALTIKLYDDFLDNVKDIWIMGGNYKGIGNVTPYAEFNFFVDPEAADILLNNTKKTITMLPWEACLSQNVTWSWRIENLNNQTPELELLTRAEEKFYNKTTLWRPADAIFAASFVNPSVISESSLHYGRVIRNDCNDKRGEVVLDDKNANAKNLRIIQKYDLDLYKKVLLELVN